MGPRRSLLAVLAILALVIAACGSSAPGETALAPATADAPGDGPSAEPTEAAGESVDPSEGGSDLPTTGRIEFPDDGYAITLPDNWFRVDLSDEGIQEMLQAGAGELPEGFDETMQAQIQQMLQSGVSLLAYRLPDDDAAMGTNINVLVLPDYGMTLDSLEALNKAQIQQIVGANAEVGASRVDLAAGEAALLEYGFESGDGSEPVGIDQYYLVGNDNQLILTCTIPGGGDVKDECRDIADSLELLQ
jgi:hypothetical protein